MAFIKLVISKNVKFFRKKEKYRKLGNLLNNERNTLDFNFIFRASETINDNDSTSAESRKVSILENF